MRCLAIITFVGGTDEEETEKSMDIMWRLVNPKLGSNVGVNFKYVYEHFKSILSLCNFVRIFSDQTL